MKISENISIEGLGLLVEKTLIVSDIHVGYEESLNKEGILVPRFHGKDIMQMLKKILEKTHPETVVINGDFKHEFGKISNQEWRDALRIIDLILEYSKKIIIVKGNHDVALSPIARKRGIELVTSLKLGEFLIVHGDEIVDADKEVKTIIIGHEHCAVSLRDGPREEKFKCFVVGKYKNKNIVGLPSFNPLIEGCDLVAGDVMSPYFKGNIDDFRIYVVSDKVYDFGLLKELR